MSKNRIQKIAVQALVFSFAFLLSGCVNYLDNPLKDKETGEDINLLILDFNFFRTRISVKLIDAKTGELVSSEAVIRFAGANGSDIVSFAGKKNEELYTTQGQLEVAVDPNVSISEDSPFQFAIHVDAAGYHNTSKGVQFTAEGKKNIELILNSLQDDEETELDGDMNVEDGDTTFVFSALHHSGLKSVQQEPLYTINYQISLQDFLKFKDTSGNLVFTSTSELLDLYNSDPDNFVAMSISKSTNYLPGTDVIDLEGKPFSVLFQLLESGNLVSLRVGGKTVSDLNGGVIKSWCFYYGTSVSDRFGFARFVNDRWFLQGTEVVYDQLNFSYIVVRASGEPLCLSGSTIRFTSEVISSFSIDADVYDEAGTRLTTLHFKGQFPEMFTAELVPSKAVRLVFRNNNPSFQPIPPLEISDFCSGNYEVQVMPAPGYIEYQIVLKAFCPDNPTIAVAPTYSGEFKIMESNNPWQGVDMVGGVVDLLGLPGEGYQLRLLWENEWEYSTLYTEFDEQGNYLKDSNSKIHSERMADGRIRIVMEQNFSQSVCNDLNW